MKWSQEAKSNNGIHMNEMIAYRCMRMKDLVTNE